MTRRLQWGRMQISYAQFARIQRLVAAGDMSLRGIASVCGVDIRTVYRYALARRKVEQVRKLVAEGADTREIATRVGVPQLAVLVIAEELRNPGHTDGG